MLVLYYAVEMWTSTISHGTNSDIQHDTYLKEELNCILFSVVTRLLRKGSTFLSIVYDINLVLAMPRVIIKYMTSLMSLPDTAQLPGLFYISPPLIYI